MSTSEIKRLARAIHECSCKERCSPPFRFRLKHLNKSRRPSARPMNPKLSARFRAFGGQWPSPFRKNRRPRCNDLL